MIPATAAAAHDLLWDHWCAGTVCERLPQTLAPLDRAAGYCIQALLEARSRAPLFGWKIAATSTAGQRHINVDGPLAGRLLAERRHASGARLSLRHNRMRVVEPEFAFAMACDLAPRSAPYRQEEVMAAVAALHLALEVPDSRFRDFTAVGAPQLIADNACAHDFVISPAVQADWRELDLAAHTVTGQIDDGPVREGKGANVLGDPRAALTWLANEVSSIGATLKAGQLVITGTCMVPLAVAPGNRVTADFGVLGQIALAFQAD